GSSTAKQGFSTIGHVITFRTQGDGQLKIRPVSRPGTPIFIATYAMRRYVSPTHPGWRRTRGCFTIRGRLRSKSIIGLSVGRPKTTCVPGFLVPAMISTALHLNVVASPAVQ